MTSYTVADDRLGRSLPSRDFPLEVRALFTRLHNDPPKLVAGLQALAADRGKSPESTLETVATLYRDDPKLRERAPITEALESALGIRLSRTIAEPPERERPPLRAYEDTPESQGQARHKTAGSRRNKPRVKPKIHNGDALSTMEFPPLRWAIEGILPAGATIFAGLPKKGKSRLTLNVGYAVSSGGYALGKIQVDQGEALYIALDDQKRRILEILKAMSPDGRIPTGLHVAFEWPRLGDGCEDELNDWLYHHRDHARFVCLDVIKHVRQIGTNKNPYLEDYAVGDALRTIAEEYQVAITGNHHANKLAFAIEEGDDPMQAISGTSGLPGGFDNTMILYQRRGVATTFLHIEGNDTQNSDLALEWDEQLLTWTIAGDAEEFTGGPEWQRAKALLRQHGPLGVIELAKLLYPDVKEIADDSTEYNRVKRLLWKAKQKGRVIARRFDKRYQLPHEKA